MANDDICRAIGKRLRARRRLLDLTQQQLARRCGGITFQQIQKYEAGAVTMPVTRLFALAGALGTSVYDLLDGAIDAATRAQPDAPHLGRRLHVAA